MTAIDLGRGILLRGLVKDFDADGGPIHAVRGIDVSIAPGETVALLGPNGAGKSSALDMLLGLSEPDAGAIKVFGMNPHEAVRAGAVGAMLQTGSLIGGLTVGEMVAMVASLYRNPMAVDELLQLAGLGRIAGSRTEKLSGGEGQRVRLALALVSDPELLVLDEPTVALDVEARRGFWATMRALRRAGQDRGIRHSLPRGSRRLRRPCGADGPRADRGRRVNHGDQGDGRVSHDPRNAAAGRSRRAWPAARRHSGRAARRNGDSHVLGL